MSTGVKIKKYCPQQWLKINAEFYLSITFLTINPPWPQPYQKELN